ncbi:MAG: hypothetical protein EXR72_10785 [Myxococcales bacterium]|nr:hypothetical protein [Myxococcales bacterium]
MIDEFLAQTVTLEVVKHLERRRPAIVDDEARVLAEVAHALEPIRRSYTESELPKAYIDALAEEVAATVPARWRAVAGRFTALEQREFGVWRGGDVVSRVVYVFVGLLVGGVCVALPFIPIWEKWFPFLLAILGWWLPNAQVALHRRRYARSLGEVAEQMVGAQRQLDRHMIEDLVLPPSFASTAKKPDNP